MGDRSQIKAATVLVVDDEDDLRNVLDFNLRNQGYKVLLAENGGQALELARTGHPNLILLDVMLPDMEGTAVCRELKRDPDLADVPIIMVTARAEEIDRVVGFELGVDDYVVKPFSVRELMLRVRAVLNRSKAEISEVTEVETLKFGGIELDPTSYRVFVDGAETRLTATEFKLLRTFINRRGRVQRRADLLDDVWGTDVKVTPRTVDTHVKRLREKLGSYAHCIETVRGVGYRFAESP